jgi:hydrogenase expression/formation protein HypD
MKFLDEYRDPAAARTLATAIRRTVTRPWTIMEICGGQTHSLLRYGIDQILPNCIQLVHGPGCPVCVTPQEAIDRAIAIAARPRVVLCTFGDMLRVPGTNGDLSNARARCADVRPVYSPLDAVRIAQSAPDRQVVFFAVGFETTAPATALAVREAARLALSNFSILAAHVRVPPAMRAILADPENRVQAFLAAGHVCTIMGCDEYQELAEEFQVPIVVTGFEPVDLLEGIWLAIRQLEAGQHRVENQYVRCVRSAGNSLARELMEAVYQVADVPWRGLGVIPRGGLRLATSFARFDAERRFPVELPIASEPAACRAGEVLRGLLRPNECEEFGNRCTPESPLGAPMVSSEGACAAYWKYQRRQAAAEVTANAQ